MSEQTKAPEKPLSEEQQWQLALAYLRRAEISAHILRALLFVAAVALIAMVLTHMKTGVIDPPFLINGASIVLAVIAIFCLVKSWQLQKEKAIERFKYFKAKNADAVALYDGVTGQLRGLQSRFWDWLAFWALAASILIQIAARTIGPAAMLLPAPLPALPM